MFFHPGLSIFKKIILKLFTQNKHCAERNPSGLSLITTLLQASGLVTFVSLCPKQSGQYP